MDKIIDNLYIGNVFEAIALFKDMGDFCACLTIGTEFVENPAYREYFTCEKVFPHMILLLNDRSKDIAKGIDFGVKFIDENINNGKVFVHCHAGVSRSPSMVYAYLLHIGMKPIKAFELLTSTRTIAHPYAGFIRDILYHYKFPRNEIDKTMHYIKSGVSK